MHNNKVNWKHLAPVAEIGQFCTFTDLEELSAANKFFRSNLQSFIIRRLKLFGYGCKLPKDFNIVTDQDNKQELITRYTVNLLKCKRYFIKHIEIYDGYNLNIANLIFETFDNLTSLKIHCTSKYLSNEALVKTLKSLKYLEHFEYFDESREQPSSSETIHLDYKLPLTISTLCIYPYGRNPVEFRPFEILSPDYVNLTRLTIFNDRLLSCINFQLRSLKYIDFITSLETNSRNIEILISNNPQLCEISICNNQLNLATTNSILSLQNLTFLSIEYTPSDQEFPAHNLAQNRSITHLQIHSLLCSNSILPVINSLTALIKLEIRSFNYTKFSLTNWSLLNIEIDKLLLNPSFSSEHYTKRNVNLAKFNSIRFFDEFELFYFQLSSNINLNNWSIKTTENQFTFYWLVNNFQN
ncbi:hypothetical protein CONCODRAFT_169837 [Conidiobolus coronatus NRRL 28638]|uniref:F-box domain-containing protein n=1 Tax=Conidiobolus coronatus (strain ATCC 28846 / CBS 209.66 / NRRL 28638) TaxID=796925 RepID=A0A137P8Y1_CONC2|nr:hypothetical protein CONCODRAFT_169837 [Conidiobolus coronatus NRRL 28638]|eukprot:KXN71467.1 hypothetical protein CONCODRAFT_169837 [Conidiobolus coronatus NRRL 28638]